MKSNTRIKKSISYMKLAQSHADYLKTKNLSKKSRLFHIAETKRQFKTAMGYIRPLKDKELCKCQSPALQEIIVRQGNLLHTLNKFPSKQSHSFRGGKNCVPHFRAGGNQKAYKHSEITCVDEQRI